MKLYLFTMDNGEEYSDYSEFTELVIGKNESDILLQMHKHELFNQHCGEKSTFSIKELSTIYGYNIKLEKQDEIIGKTTYFDVILGLEVVENRGEIIDKSYNADVQEYDYTILTEYGEILKLNELEIKCII